MFDNDNDLIELKLSPIRKLFPVGNNESDFKIYACSTTHDGVKLNTFGNFVINGTMQDLTLFNEYKAVIEFKNHAKYGDSYQVHNIRTEMPTTIEGKHRFLRTILSETQATLLINNFPSEDVISMIQNDTLPWEKVKGMGETTYKKIKEKIEENIDIQEALIELSAYGVTFTIIKKLMSEFNKPPALLVEKVKENPYILCNFRGLGFKKVDEYALKIGIKKDSPFRIEAGIMHELKESENEGNCWIERNEAIERFASLTQISEDIITELIEKGKVNGLYYTKDVVARTHIYETEYNMTQKLKELVTTESFYTEMLSENVEEKIKEVEEEQGFEFTKEQREGIYQSIHNNVLTISGKAGTGKTALIKGIMKVLDSLSYATCALSGKAAQRIEESTGLNSSTIHRLLGFSPDGGFMFDEHRNLPYIITLGDESSMNNSILQYQLIQAIANGNKIIMVGDVAQLPAIGVGSPFSDMIESGVIPKVELTVVHRQAKLSGILSTANLVRDGHQIIPKDIDEPMIIGELKDLYLVPKTGDDLFDYIMETSMEAREKCDLFDFQVIVPMKTRGKISCKSLNVSLQGIFNNLKKPYISRGGYDYRVGDKVIKNGNDYDNMVFNGTMGVITHIDFDEKEVTILFGTKNTTSVTYTQTNLDQIDMAYALTCHRFQGSQCKNVLCALDYSAYKLLNKQWVYTALTRAESKCIFAFEPRALRYAITQDHVKRKTFLRNMLKNIFKEKAVVESEKV